VTDTPPELPALDPALVRRWRILASDTGKGGGYAGQRACASCGQQAYCAGATYERQVCLRCYAGPSQKRAQRATARPAAPVGEPRVAKYPPQLVAAVKADLQAGMSQAEARVKHQVPRSTVWAWAKEVGLVQARKES
jgi:hypothetical protein